jgi:hypothetical protein
VCGAPVVGLRQCRFCFAGVGVGPAVFLRCCFSGVNVQEGHLGQGVVVCSAAGASASYGCQIDTLLLELLERLCLVRGTK